MMARSDGGADDDGEIGAWILRKALKQRGVRLFEMVMDDVYQLRKNEGLERNFRGVRTAFE